MKSTREIVTAEIFGRIDTMEYIPWVELRNHNVRYVGTDNELSNYDIYEYTSTGKLVATTL
jgi:hypothetical protein